VGTAILATRPDPTRSTLPVPDPYPFLYTCTRTRVCTRDFTCALALVVHYFLNLQGFSSMLITVIYFSYMAHSLILHFADNTANLVHCKIDCCIR